MIRKASCCCRKCFLEVEGEPFINAVCHCRSCKRRSGSAFGWSAYFNNSQILKREGELKVYDVSGEVSVQRYFCAVCGTTLLWKAPSQPDFTGIAAGCFDDSPLPEPSMTAWNEWRCAWVTLPDSMIATS